MKIIVTGAAGFIGSNLVKALNQRGIHEIIAVDDLSKAEKFRNLVNCEIADFIDKTDFLVRLNSGQFNHIDALFHEGACSDTMATDGRYVMSNNYSYSCDIAKACLAQRIQFLYASSAAVYGASKVFSEAREFEAPLNVYGYSKFLFDQWVRRILPQANSQIVGFRYFNVYGPHEQHKGRMASVAFHNANQFYQQGYVNLFDAYDGYGPGGHMRDFVSVEDVAKVNLFFLDHPEKSGIFNLGTGKAQSFNDVAHTVVKTLSQFQNTATNPKSAKEIADKVQYIPFPEALKGRYQSFTQANLTLLRAAGYAEPFLTVEQGVARYCEWLAQQHTDAKI